MPDGFDDAIEERFEIGAPVGSGAYGEVHRGKDRQSGAPVAIKRLLSTRDPTNVLRFEREARLLAQIESPYVVRYIAHGRDAAGKPTLVLEWLGGSDLARLRRTRALPIGESVAIVRQAALGLHALHLAGVVHRDVKPANFVAVSDTGSGVRIKLIDLGIARTQNEPQLTQDGFAVGTLSYMSPEQIRCERMITPQADLFSLGVTLYELLCGVRPFVDRDPNALLAKILLHDPVRVRSRVAGISQSLDEAVHRALSKRASDRFESARAMADALVVPDTLPAKADVAEPEASTFVGVPTHSGRLVGGEQRVVAALFASFAADGTFESISAAFREIVATHRGVVHQFPGYRAIGVFGDDGSRGDEVQWAARAALALRTRVASIRLAISTCRVQVGRVGLSEDAIQSGVEQLARAGECILIDVTSARILDAGFHIEEIDAGKVLGPERAVGARAIPKLLGRETTTVGRDRELRTLDALLDECVSESQARAVLLTGPAGVGKSRLRHEWIGRTRERLAIEPLFARGDPVRAGSPFSLIVQFVRVAAQLVDGEPVAVVRRKIFDRVARRVPAADVARVADFLCEMIGAAVTEGPSVQLTSARSDAALMADQLRRAWVDWLSAECDATSLVLVIEDLHWGDVSSVKLIEYLLRSLEQRPVFVVAFARPEVHAAFPNLWAKARLEQIRVDGLSRRAAEKLVRDVLGDRVGTAIVASLVDRAEGNAFYLEELIRATADGKTGVLPESVLLMVQSRLATLASSSRHVLRVASVFGEAFWKGALAVAIELDDDQGSLTDVLQSLEADEVIARRSTSRFASEDEYVFRHALLREGAYATLGDSDRTVAHRSAVDWLERTGETDASVLAKHAELGGDARRAIMWYTRAAERALEGDDLQGALSLAERGVALGAAGEALGALRLIQGNAYWWRGELVAGQQAALEALVLLPRPSSGWYAAVRLTATVAIAVARYDWLDELVHDLDSLRQGAQADVAYLWAIARVAFSLLTRGPSATVDRLLAIVGVHEAELASRAPLVAAVLVSAQTRCALIAGNLGDWRSGLCRLASIYERAGNVGSALNAHTNIGYSHMLLGEYDAAATEFRVVIARADQLGLRHVAATAHHNLGYSLACVGRLDEARAEQRIALETYLVLGNSHGAGHAHNYLARAEILAGDFERGEREARASMERLAAVPGELCDSLAVLAQALLLQGRLDEARDVARRSADISEQLRPTGPESVFARWVQATVFDAVGDRERARTVMTAARAVVLTSAETIHDPQLRASYIERVAENAAVLASPLARAFE